MVEAEDSALSAAIAKYLAQFVQANAGAGHPISDRWAISLAPLTLLLALHGRDDVIHSFLLSAVRWIADRYDDGNLGLAGPYSSATEETNRLLGPPFEFISLRRRNESFVASLTLDLASVLENQNLYDAARNEFLAVDIVLPVMEVDDDLGQFGRHLGQPRFEPNMPYDEYWTPREGWKCAPHHKRGAFMHYPERVVSPWNQLALSAVLRDRHSVNNWRRILGKTVSQ